MTDREHNTFSLKEAGEFDARTNQKSKLTGWGRICKERNAAGISRKQRRLKREAT